MDANQPLVLDNGTGLLKAGFAGSDLPSVVYPSCVGRPKHQRTMVQSSKLQGDVFAGKLAEEHRGVLKLNYPMSHGIVENWSDMERVWSHVYDKENLNTPSEEHPVLLTEAPLNPTANREKAAEIFFESFNVPSFFMSPQATLSLYASGRTTGVVLDSGDGVTHAVPVYEGFSSPHAISRIDVAGRDVTEYLQLLLRRAGYIFHTSAEKEVVRKIKEDICYVAFNSKKEEKLETEHQNTLQAYKLPDGRVINIGPERFRAPEILFNPSLIGSEYRGAHECLADAIFKSDMDIRKTLFAQVVLSGGSTMYTGYGDRLLNEVRKCAQKASYGTVKIKISAPPNRHLLTWMGGSILASLATFKTMWVRRDEYEEYGASAIHRKSLS